MNNILTVSLEELMATRLGTVNPIKHPDEVFELYSIPSYDSRAPEVVRGSEIGSAKQAVQSRDVLLSKIVPHIRRSWIVGDETSHRLIASGEWIVFRSPKAHPEYLRHVLLGDKFHAQFMQTVSGVGGSLLRARPAQVAKISIPLPSLPEQHRIAAILDKADALRTKRREALAQLDCLAQSIFVEMFGDPAQARATTNYQHLNNCLAFLTSGGRGWAKYYSETGSRFVRSLDVQMNRIGTDDKVFVTPPQNAEAKRTRVSSGDVLLTITGSLIGRVATAPAELDGAYISQHVAILRLSKEVLEPEFLSYFLSLETGGQRQIAKSQYGQTKPGLNFEQIRAFRVPVPSIERQRQFLARVRRIDELRRTGLSALREVECLFSSLQHRAFCGEL